MGFASTHKLGRARELLASIEAAVGFDDKTGLVRAAPLRVPDAEQLNTFENISLAILYFLLGNARRAEDVLHAVEQHIGNDTETGLFFNKRGVSEHEEDAVLPGEKTIYLTNQVLVFVLLFLLKNHGGAKNLFSTIKKHFKKFSFHGYEVYKHSTTFAGFYAFNTLFMALAEYMTGDIEESKKLVAIIKELCWDEDVGLLMVEPDEKIYFVLDNAVLAWLLKLQDEDQECTHILKTIENQVGKDPNTGLFYRGVRRTNNTMEPIPPSLTYLNTVLGIAYATSAELFPKDFSNL